jgi:predicted CxxxxCH...CXXCH cytochrome family protein
MSLKYSIILLYKILPVSLLIIIACSSPNSQSNFNPETGQHVSNWYPTGHKTAALNEIASCAGCHGSEYAGGISGVSCRKCHINNSPGSFSCSECHGYPPNTDKHTSHVFPNVSCIDCHIDTIGTSKHNNGSVDIAIASAYNANSGAATYSSSGNACSNVRCHGGPRTQTTAQAGQTPPQSTLSLTPSWITGTIDVNTQCSSCHVYGTSEFNSYSSGRHNLHVYGQGRACTDCHDTAKLAVSHFTMLNTTAMEGPASATILNSVNYSGTTCNPACHGNETWR